MNSDEVWNTTAEARPTPQTAATQTAATRAGDTRTGALGAGALVMALWVAACSTDASIERPMPLAGDVPIEYPLEMWDRDVEGETLLRVLVSEEGRVSRVEVLQSSGHAALDSAAVGGARDLRFQPALRNGRRIEVWATVPVHFSKQREPRDFSRPGG